MRLLLPMNSEDVQEAELVKIEDATTWAQLLIEDGELVEVNHAKKWEDFEIPSEYVVVANSGEYVWPFIEYNMLVLVAPFQRRIDDILEAYLFKELHELEY
ncbi:hypothetical protein MNB_SM-7-121 [hydrothermal vent metagenome]|uniref:Uncharacterized protein n=1 Tax=hydrothermal vent metagenome TaxID=652676 RepID=A0A1W1BBW7_9ZZZZ